MKLSNPQPSKLIITGAEVTLKISSNVVGDSNDENNFPHKSSLTNTRGFLGRLLGPFPKIGLPLMVNVLKPLAKTVLGLTAAISAINVAIHKKMFGSSVTTLIVSNEEMKNIMEIVKSREESDLLIKSASETIKNEVKEQKGGFFVIL